MESESRPFDIVIFGASGYTGTYVVEELAKNGGNVKYAIAGRSRVKLQSVLEHLSSMYIKAGKSSCFENVEIIVADVENCETISDMCLKTKLVINCVGPYRFFGEQVVKECVKNSTHYIDVCAEVQFLEAMQLKYLEEAKAKGIYVIGACGFDSVPCDLGIEVLKDKFHGDINSVEAFLQFEDEKALAANFATWQSVIYGLVYASDLKPLRKEFKKTLFKKTIPENNFPARKRSYLFKKENFWCIPSFGSDKSVATRTQLYNYEFHEHRPVQVQTYMCLSALSSALGILFLGLIFMILVKFSWGRSLLENYPAVFSFGVITKAVPKREEPGSCALNMTFEAEGWHEKLEESSDKYMSKPDKNLKAVLSFPDGPYISTAICVVGCALVFLNESEKFTEKGGVFTPAAVFKDSSLLQHLQARGVSFKTFPITSNN